ncbi:tRNA modification GTPase MnmE [Thalassovita gelatinovora]|uniref:tRNA modification GTPase MnmE n=1 Tax=Thalassovita gelatinovora TaxID=53501 RepID=A0A0P1FA96_THAGE|nr:tRNA uridine-5-carboxymethylaminomethyl(34) synthesis GTPase MnmE [Thalassovita gelatinovora]QIZ81054.1 tRNA uridine-5-carboxymethylaminomethyl(34) synthesis GTPase MnmE [Thalassovita gelatinovora]CUH64987.1 tRNA modification GTPase MnmE [Thalassovita gelatinovora]SEP88381.1 tRNA modification GTPase trmE [Thalassovita gelatinovora]
MDTIFALATAHGKAGVAVIRVSGPLAFSAGEHLAGTLPEPRKAGLRLLRDGQGVRLDEALILCFPDKSSFTGETVVEFQLHGSTAVVAAVLRELGQFDGLRHAEPGEFTRRALENGRLDLAQVEGLADLIEAETEAQRRQALRVLSGDLGNRAEEWRRDLIRAASLLEATIDFADEDIPVDVSPEVNELLDRVMISVNAEIAGVSAAERVRTGFEVAIVGAPNVGKSTLLNALAGRDAAITSEYAGTTRDVIEVRMDLGGLPVTLLDTAGLRDTQDKVEEIGIARARERAALADLRVFLIEGDQAPDFAPLPDDIILKAKADLLQDKSGAVSGTSGEGVANLINQITECLSHRTSSIGIATRERHRLSMQKAVEALQEAMNLVAMGGEMSDIAAEEMRTAIRALDALIGRVDVENLLDEIFSSFCLGK